MRKYNPIEYWDMWRQSFQPPQGAPMQPPPVATPSPPQQEDNTLSSMLGMLGRSGAMMYGMNNAVQNGPLPQWTGTNDAARMIESGAYPDPLLRQAATWNVPSYSYWNRLRGMR